jgi:hypothetical protein
LQKKKLKLPPDLARHQHLIVGQPLAIAIISGLLLQFPLVLLIMPGLIGLTLPKTSPESQQNIA